MMGDFYNYGPGFMFGFSWIFMLIFWGLIIWGVITLIKSSMVKDNNDHKEIKDKDKALSILKERYAKSEISKEEYEEKKTDLVK